MLEVRSFGQLVKKKPRVFCEEWGAGGKGEKGGLITMRKEKVSGRSFDKMTAWNINHK